MCLLRLFDGGLKASAHNNTAYSNGGGSPSEVSVLDLFQMPYVAE